MDHQEFVLLWGQGGVNVHIDKNKATNLVDSAVVPKGERLAQSFWIYVMFSVFILGIVLMFTWGFWKGTLVFIFGMVMAPAIQKSATQAILRLALEDESFFYNAQHHGVLRVELKAPASRF